MSALKEAIVFCPYCGRDWTFYYERAAELPDDMNIPCSGCEADRVPLNHLQQMDIAFDEVG